MHTSWYAMCVAMKLNVRRNSMNITHEERVKFLNAHNDLKSMLMTIHECNDLWISDVGKLESLEVCSPIG